MFNKLHDDFLLHANSADEEETAVETEAVKDEASVGGSENMVTRKFEGFSF